MSDEASVRAFKKSAEEHGFHPESLEYRYMSVGWDEATRQAEARMRAPLPPEICKHGHPRACRKREPHKHHEHCPGDCEQYIEFCSACHDIARLIAEAQAVTVEQVIHLLRGISRMSTEYTLVEKIRALSPDPDFLARERLKARVEEAQDWDTGREKAVKLSLDNQKEYKMPRLWWVVDTEANRPASDGFGVAPYRRISPLFERKTEALVWAQVNHPNEEVFDPF